ncbi:MAG: alpha/beta fold hydrolase [Anaerolineaceae bacterium]|nr:MAG: alpha/beta fold hydrolase [Anaerolineaceae bacterium]
MKAINYITIKQKDGYITKLTYLSCPKKPKASILILHGMAEHQKRYTSYAQYLVDLGFDVFLYDHRGHGTDKKLNELGFFSYHKGYQLVIDDAITVSQYIEQNNRCNKFFLFGHSMGSLIARNVIQTYDKYNGVILSGTAYPPKFLLLAGLFMTSLVKKIKGPKYISPFLKNLLFGGNKYTKLADRTAFDWLTRSYPVVGAYIHDPYCGFICTSSFYHDLLKITSNASNKKLIRMTKLEMPMFIISGERDPVGAYGKDIKRLLSKYKKIGFTNIAYKLYPDCRHELLNELNKDEVYSDINHWLTKRI